MPQYILNPSIAGLQIAGDQGNTSLRALDNATAIYLNNLWGQDREREARLYEMDRIKSMFDMGLGPNGQPLPPTALGMSSRRLFPNYQLLLESAAQALSGYDYANPNQQTPVRIAENQFTAGSILPMRGRGYDPRGTGVWSPVSTEQLYRYGSPDELRGR